MQIDSPAIPPGVPPRHPPAASKVPPGADGHEALRAVARESGGRLSCGNAQAIRGLGAGSDAFGGGVGEAQFTSFLNQEHARLFRGAWRHRAGGRHLSRPRCAGRHMRPFAGGPDRAASRHRSAARRTARRLADGAVGRTLGAIGPRLERADGTADPGRPTAAACTAQGDGGRERAADPCRALRYRGGFVLCARARRARACQPMTRRGACLRRRPSAQTLARR